MYHEELVLEQNRLSKMIESGEADEYSIRQQNRVVEETKSVVPLVREKLQAALEVLENQLAGAPETEPAENKEKAEKAIADAKAVLGEKSSQRNGVER